MAYQPNPDRYGQMEYRRCGQSGLKLPVVSLGMWHNFGKGFDFENMKQMCFTAFDCGITHFDVANNYGYPYVGSAEEHVGKILREEFSAHRNELIVSTKAGYWMWDGPYGEFGSRKYLLASLDDSLKRLQLDYVDIFYSHRPDPETPLEETMGALASAVQSGKALYVGLSNYNGEQMRRAAAILKELHCPFVINQNRYSMLDRTVEQNGLQAACADEGKGLILFCPLEQGMLTDRYLSGIPADSRVKTNGVSLKADHLTAERLDRIRRLNEVARGRGQSLAEMALAWLLDRPAVTSVLIGASKPEQIRQNAKAAHSAPFSAEERALLDEICGVKA